LRIENVKLIVDILKFKVMLFTGVLGSGVYLILNMTKLKAYINDFVLSLIVMSLFFYGLFGFVNNMLQLNKVLKKLKKE